MTLSDAFPVDVAAATRRQSPEAAPQRGRLHARMRARGLSVPRVTAAFKVVGADLRESWWVPPSLPTVARAWSERFPDRDRVPGDHVALYCAWLVYNHTIGLLVPALALALVGVLTPLVWVARHPARLLLTAVVVVPVVATLVAVK